MSHLNLASLAQRSLNGELLSHHECRQVLSDPGIELLPLLNEAYVVRKHTHGKDVHVHIINNAQNGFCPEDCGYCAQAKTSAADIEEYPLKPDAEILAEAKNAYEKGAFRYCMVFAGRGPSPRRVEHLAKLIRDIKSKYPIEICVSAGLMNEAAARTLKEAGLDRLNHNLNTSERRYPEICTTHTFEDRLNTLRAAQTVGLEMCSGIIVGMGEELDDVIDIGIRLREMKVKSIPVNFLIPIPGNQLKEISNLTPEYCLRILCLYRFLNPTSELRVAAGREGHLRSLEVLALYPANSLFLDGYLNTKGSNSAKTLRMIKDAGFNIKSEFSVDDLLGQETPGPDQFNIDHNPSIMKELKDLRPKLSTLNSAPSPQKA